MKIISQRGLIAVGWLYLIGIVALLVVLSGIAYKIRESGKESVRIEWAAANEEQRKAEAERAAKAASTLEAANAKAKLVYRTITKEVDKIVVEYRDRACLDERGVLLVNAAIRGEVAPAAQPDKPLPRP